MSARKQFGKGVRRLSLSYKLYVISRIWADRCMVVELQFGGWLFAFLYQAITSPLTLSSIGLSAHHFSPFLSSCLSHNFLKCSSSGSACSLLAMETLRTAVLASPAQGSYNYLLTSYLLTTSYNYTESFFFFQKENILSCSVNLFSTSCKSQTGLISMFLSCHFFILQSFLSRSKSVKYGTAELH